MESGCFVINTKKSIQVGLNVESDGDKLMVLCSESDDRKENLDRQSETRCIFL